MKTKKKMKREGKKNSGLTRLAGVAGYININIITNSKPTHKSLRTPILA